MLINTLFTALIAGWFASVIINYLADTLPIHRRFIKPTCTSCGKAYTVGSYLFHFKCNNCNHRHGFRQLITLIIMLVLAFVIFFFSSATALSKGIDLLVAGYLLLIIVIDIEHHLVLHTITAAGSVIFGVLGFKEHGVWPTLLGGIVGFVIMYLFFILGHFYSQIKSKRSGVEIEDAIGFGDVTFSGVCGLLLGWPNIVAGLTAGIVLGGVWSLGILFFVLFKKSGDISTSFMAYAPFIAIATCLLWFLVH